MDGSEKRSEDCVKGSVRVLAEDNILEGLWIITKTSQLWKLVSQPRFEYETSQTQILKHCGVSQSAWLCSQVLKQIERKAMSQNIHVIRHQNHRGLLWIQVPVYSDWSWQVRFRLSSVILLPTLHELFTCSQKGHSMKAASYLGLPECNVK